MYQQQNLTSQAAAPAIPKPRRAVDDRRAGDALLHRQVRHTMWILGTCFALGLVIILALPVMLPYLPSLPFCGPSAAVGR